MTMASTDGGYLFVSSLFATLLTFNVDPVAAMGVVAPFCIPLFLSVLDLMSVDAFFGLSTGTWKLILIVFIAASTYGMLT